MTTPPSAPGVVNPVEAGSATRAQREVDAGAAATLRAVPFGDPFTGHTDTVGWGVWGRVGDRPILATGGRDGTVRLWDPQDRGPLGDPLTGHTDAVRWGVWGRVGDRPILATGGDGGTVRLWDPQDRGPLGDPLTGHTGEVVWGVWGRVGDRPILATGGDGGTVRLWDPQDRGPLGDPLTGHTTTVVWGVWGRVGDRPILATGGDGGTVRLWDPQDRGPLGDPLTGHTGDVLWGVWGRVGDRPILATGGDGGTVRLWDPQARGPLGDPLTGHTGAVVWGVWGRVGDRPILATGGVGGTVRLWDPQARGPLGDPLTAHRGGVWWGVWGRVGDRPILATGGVDGTVRLWEVIGDRAVPRLPSYRSDATADDDALDRGADAAALAELITARSARPPLAVGLFGDWGEGKSHFLGLLQQRVTAVARPGNVLAHQAVRQVRFNAWHYAETDLWASLVAELFAQLAAPPGGERGAEQRRQSRLASELINQRGLRERLQAARARRDTLQAALNRAGRDTLGAWDGLDDHQKQQLELLGGEQAKTAYQDAVRTVASLAETGRASWRFLRSLRPLAVVRLLLVLAGACAAAVVAAWVVPAVAGWVAALPAAATLLAIAAAVRQVRADTALRAGPLWQAAVRLAAGQRDRLTTAADVAAAEVDALERQVQNLTAAGQLAGLVTDRVAGADYRSRLGVMTQIREDFTAMARLLAAAAHDHDTHHHTPDSTPVTGPDTSREPGPDGQDPAAASGAAPQQGTRSAEDEAGDRLPEIDRIIIYIDDLDRCPPARVVEMLEAIHLLLAVELFVVVVAVDPRWLLRAITAHYRDLLHSTDDTLTAPGPEVRVVDPDDEELWRSTPAQYLEKIFQVVLTLPPLDTTGYQRLIRTLVGTRIDQPTPAPTDTSTDTSTATSPIDQPAIPRSAGDPTAPVRDEDEDEDEDEGLFGTELPPAQVVERVDPLTLEPDELTLLDLLGPPLLVATPRGAKRLANSYGLLTAIRRGHRAADLADHHAVINDTTDTATDTATDSGAAGSRDVTYRPYRAGMVLLAGLVAFPALGPALFLHLHHTAATHPGHSWTKFLDTLQPVWTPPNGWSNPADPQMTPVQAQQWRALLAGLRHVATAATERNLPLPEPLTAWADWVVPVGRLSFPTGRIVSSLDRQQPLDPAQPARSRVPHPPIE